jgi:hypothetical protein
MRTVLRSTTPYNYAAGVGRAQAQRRSTADPHFEGFYLLTTHGQEERLHSREHAIERLVTRAWAERQVITVFVLNQHPHVPVTIVVRSAPEPFQH